MQRSTLALLLVIAALTATSLWLWRDREQALAQVATLQANQATASVTDAAASVTGTEPAAVAMANVAESAETATDPPPKKDYGEFERRILQDPNYREARRNFRELELMAGHLDLAKALGITPEKARRLIALYVDRELEYLDQRNLNPRNEAEIEKRQAQAEQRQRDLDMEVVALLGERKYAEWAAYSASLQVRHEVNQLGSSLFAAGAPLKEEQIEPLIAAIQAERARARQELKDYTDSLVWSDERATDSHRYRDEREVELSEAANRRVHDAASKILSRPQLDALDLYLKRRLELEEAQTRMHGAQADWLRLNAGGG